MAGQGYGYGGGYGYGQGYGYGYGQPRNPIPPGWFECPPIGQVSDWHRLIPMKVPLGSNYKVRNMDELSQQQWTPFAALQEADRLIKEKDMGATVGAVIDLSNTDKYYDSDVITANNVKYIKVPCRGRGMSPDPLAVNMAVWEIRKALATEPHNYILVHCTHGYNRSGFIIISAMMRLLADQGICVERCIRRFKEQRPPGIYKDGYIQDLFRRHNEHRPRIESCLTPPLPAWKPADDEDEDERLGQGYTSMPEPQAAAGRISHTDKVGEPVCMEEARYIMNCVFDIIQAQDTRLKGGTLLGFPHQQELHRGPGDLFIGSQPVSLDLVNLNLVKQKRYYVTWKADGTRYLLLCMREGAYFIDRSGEVRRTHMRFPTLYHVKQGQPKPAHPVGPPHNWTLLDGEMVVDEVDISGEQQRRRYLAYDCIMLAGEGVSDLRFKDRYSLIEREVVMPRQIEKHFFGTQRNQQFIYDYDLELCSLRQKKFYPLQQGHSLLKKFIPELCHESDGLILQPADDPYIPRTYPHLLKWKFRHMNSVDFKLDALPGKPPVLMLNCAMRRKGRQIDVNHLPLSAVGVPHATVEFPNGEDPMLLHGKIIECSFDPERRVWTYMRDRPDKLTANHRSVFDKVMASIEDNITEEFLLGVFHEALQLPIYESDAQRAQNPAAAGRVVENGAAPQQQQQHIKAPVLHQQQQPQQQLPPHQQHQPYMQQQQQQQQQRQTTPEVRQQLTAGRGYKGPSPILTPPPGAESINGVPDACQQQYDGEVTAAADGDIGDDPSRVPANEQGHTMQEVEMDNSEDNIREGDPDADHMQEFAHDVDADMQQDQQVDGEEAEDEPYHVTEQGDLDEESGGGVDAEEEC